MQARSLCLYGNTLRHLKSSQVVYQAWYRLPALFRAGSLRENGTRPAVAWNRIASKAYLALPTNSDPRSLSRGRFRFINDELEFPNGVIDWQVPNKSRLWRYNLHYFDYLKTDPLPSADVALRLMDDWVSRNPKGTPDAWDPYPISLRIVNWIKYFSVAQFDSANIERLVLSMYQQALLLERSLEKHLLANHFFKNLKALIFAGLFFQGKDADRWLAKGIVGLQEQLGEQILPDGGHFERSPMYHSMILEDCLDLLNVCSNRREPKVTELSGRLAEVGGKMVRFLSDVVQPDAQIPLFNDAAFGIEAEPAHLLEYHSRMFGKLISGANGAVRSFPDSGYFIMQPKADDFLIIDCGPIGPDYQPGHAHCDTLSFELSLSGRRVIVDSGCYEYEDTDVRQYNRGNAGHNTLTIDGLNQSEVWASHRCGRRAYPLYARLYETPERGLRFEGAHDGYRWLSGSPIHHREVVWSGKTLSITDRIEGTRKHGVELRLHINPELEIERVGSSVLIKDNGAPLTEVSALSAATVGVDAGWYCPEFGIKKACHVLTIVYKSAPLPLATGWRFELLK